MVNVCMISDFFYPSMGGVENHVYQLSQCLLMQGHKVVVVTHRYGKRCGVRWLPRGLKVYYLPFCGVHDRVMLPTGLVLLPLLRDVLIRERITMVHAHAVCTMALEAVTLCSLMGYRVVYTEHSNFGMSSATDINLNALERFVLSLADTVGTTSLCPAHRRPRPRTRVRDVFPATPLPLPLALARWSPCRTPPRRMWRCAAISTPHWSTSYPTPSTPRRSSCYTRLAHPPGTTPLAPTPSTSP